MSRLPKSEAVATCFEEYRKKILTAMDGEPLDPQAIAFAQASFYFGSLAMLGLLEPVAERAKSESLHIAMEGLRAEVERFIEAQAAPLN